MGATSVGRIDPGRLACIERCYPFNHVVDIIAGLWIEGCRLQGIERLRCVE